MNILSISGGKDSVAMALIMKEKGIPIDRMVYVETGMDYDCIKTVLDKLEVIIGVKIDRLKMKYDFETLFKKYGFCGGLCRYGTTYKLYALKEYYKQFENYQECVGIAYDEQHRIKAKCYPLIEYEYTEKMCLEKCREYGFEWIEEGIDLYEIMDRVSCWCCRNKNKKELIAMMKFLPKKWEKLKEMEKEVGKPFKNYWLEKLENENN